MCKCFQHFSQTKTKLRQNIKFSEFGKFLLLNLAILFFLYFLLFLHLPIPFRRFIFHKLLDKGRARVTQCGVETPPPHSAP
jgi:hypothetical protein